MRRFFMAVAVILSGCGGGGAKPSGPDAGCVDPGRAVADEGHWHITDGGDWPYISQPPASGPHAPTPGGYGVYNHPLRRETYVHNEEHGGVVLLYNCPSGCPDVLNAFERLANERTPDQFGEVKVIVTPDPLYDGGQFAAAAWDSVYTPATLDEDALRCFIDRHIDQGPEHAP
jgi:hypothetical protein